MIPLILFLLFLFLAIQLYRDMAYTISDGCPAFLKSQNDARDKFADFGQPVKIWPNKQ